MTDLRLHRHITSVRRGSDAGPTHVNILMEIAFRGSRIYAKLDESPDATTDMNGAAEALLASGCSAIPRRRLDDAVVESGWVTDRIFHDSHEIASEERRFLYAACGGALFELTDRPVYADNAGSAPEVVETCLADAHLPVVLSPSAVLAVIEHCEENGEEDGEFNPLLSISRKWWSPYPPHSIPDSLHRNEWPGESLSIRPDWWSQPFGALPSRFGSLQVLCNIATAPPPQALLLDSVIPLENGAGGVECEAEFSILREGRRGAISARAVTLLLDRRRLLNSVTSAISNPRAGRSFDPITGDRFGKAPMLLTVISSGELMEALR
jgi:hypothetical protein